MQQYYWHAGNVKSERDFEAFLRERGFSRADARRITKHGILTPEQKAERMAEQSRLAAWLRRAAEVLAVR